MYVTLVVKHNLLIIKNLIGNLEQKLPPLNGTVIPSIFIRPMGVLLKHFSLFGKVLQIKNILSSNNII